MRSGGPSLGDVTFRRTVGERRRVLLVEDDDAIRQHIDTLLATVAEQLAGADLRPGA